MANWIEAGRDYLVNVAERTLGIEASRSGLDPYSHKPLFLSSGVIQVVLPASTSYLMSEDESTFDKNLPYLQRLLSLTPDTAKFFAVLAVDLAPPIIYLLNTNPHNINLGEMAVLKLTANAATHVGLDILGAAAQRIRNFRPSATTLAV